MKYQQVYDAVKSALSGNGKFKVNYQIRLLKSQLVDEFYFDKEQMDDLIIDYTNAMLVNHVAQEKYDPARSNFQTFINGVVRNYLLNTVKTKRKDKDNWINRRSGEIAEAEIISQYDTDMESFIENAISGSKRSDRPDEQVSFDELKGIIIDSVSAIDLLVFQGRLTQREAARRSGMSLGKYNKVYNTNITLLQKRLKDAGFLEK